MNRKEFIALITPGAIQGYKDYGILPSVTIAQAILESGTGTSQIAKQTNNLFGVKGVGTAGSYQTQTGKYRVYNNFNESILDHNKVLGTQSNFEGVRNAKDFKTAINGLNAGKPMGYAEDPNYGIKLVSIINSNELYKLDQAVQNKGTKTISVNGIEYNVDNLPSVESKPNYQQNSNPAGINVLRPGETPTETNQVKFTGVMAGVNTLVTKVLFILAGILVGYLAIMYLFNEGVKEGAKELI